MKITTGRNAEGRVKRDENQAERKGRGVIVVFIS